MKEKGLKSVKHQSHGLLGDDYAIIVRAGPIPTIYLALLLPCTLIIITLLNHLDSSFCQLLSPFFHFTPCKREEAMALTARLGAPGGLTPAWRRRRAAHS